MGVEPDPPELDNVVSGWMRRFGIASRCRPQSMGGIAPVSPIHIMELCEKLQWPCGYETAVHVITSMDDTYRELNQPNQQHQAAH